MDISTATRADLATILDWAAAEGWNPGLDDGAAFHATDPEGFLVGHLGGTPVTAISVVRQGPDQAFLGLFITRPEHRGKGYGQRIWEAGMTRMAGRTVGLDGVEAQQGRYAGQGFETAFTTTRHGGVITPPAGAPSPLTPCDATHLPELLALDREAMGHDRSAYLSAWLTAAPTRRTHLLIEDGRIRAFATHRRCREGAKIGPLMADDVATAETLLTSVAALGGGGTVYVDIPDTQQAFGQIAQALGLAPVFRTARMYHGPAPALSLDRVFGLTTLELG
ncbi:MAG: GNAT family N-acetyltransferase [Pseudomonadota bacterium]